jgi:NAD-dependent deacetylase
MRAELAADDARARLHQLLIEGRRMVAFTGAGISTEAGVPDFRTPGSPWMVNKPIPYEAFVASAEARKEAWRRKFAMDDSYQGAEPTPAHRLLAGLVQKGLMQAIITQNIDGLHHAAGTPEDRVIEIHGNGTFATCLDCGTRHEIAEIRAYFAASGHAPPCRACGGIVKSATISFGQRMPEAAMRRADALARACDLFLVMGSSLVVYPAAQLPLVAAASGAKLVILNREPTPLDAHADLVLRGEIGALLSGFNSL